MATPVITGHIKTLRRSKSASTSYTSVERRTGFEMLSKCFSKLHRIALAICCLALFVTGCSDSGNEGAATNGITSGITKSTASKSDTPAAAPKKGETTSKADSGKSDSADASSRADIESKKSVEDSPRPSPAPEDSPKKIKVSSEPDINEPEFHEALLAATEEYLRYGMVNSIVLQAPEACAPAADAPKPLMSESEHESSHGKKLYFLFAKEIGHYVNPEGKPAPVGQVVVKESWTSSPANPAARNLINHASGNRVDPRAKVGDKTLEIGQRKNFFVMTKLAVDTPKTDKGWVYGVVDADTRKVVASGKVASCMSCHVQGETNDRLFGSKHVSFEETVVSEVPKPENKESEKKAAEKETLEEKSVAAETPEKTASKNETAKAESPKTEGPKSETDAQSDQ